MSAKCKGSDHVTVVSSAAPGDPVGVWHAAKVYGASCKNDRDYDGDVVVLIRNARPGMQMFPELAEVMPERLRFATQGGHAARITHRVLGLVKPYATLSFAAALALAEEIEEVR